jgi:hypothetical protein
MAAGGFFYRFACGRPTAVMQRNTARWELRAVRKKQKLNLVKALSGVRVSGPRKTPLNRGRSFLKFVDRRFFNDCIFSRAEVHLSYDR